MHSIPKVFKQSARIDLSQTLEVIDLERGLSVFRLVRTGEIADSVAHPALASLANSVTIQGFAKPAAIRAFTDGKLKTIATLDVWIGDDVFFDAARKFGYVSAFEAHGEAISERRAQAFELAQTGLLDLDHLFVDDNNSHMLFHRDGKTPHAAGVYFDYIQGRIKNGTYHLYKLLALLKADPRVHALSGMRARRGAKKKAELEITPIPYYNRASNASETIEFIFSPTDADMAAMWSEMRKLNKKYPSTRVHEAVFNLDLLGVVSGGAAKYRSFDDCDGSAMEEPSEAEY